MIELWRIDLKKKYIVFSDDPEVKRDWLRDLEELQQNLEQESKNNLAGSSQGKFTKL